MGKEEKPKTLQEMIDLIRYNYPFENTAKEHGVRFQNGFKVQEAIDKTKGTILEIGGPSDLGFYFLQGCSFPRRPVITNVDYKGGMQGKFYRDLYKRYIERKLDIRKNVLHDGSVGVCLASCLNVFAYEPRRPSEKAWDKKWEELAEEDKALKKDPKIQPKIGLRFMLLKYAKEFLEDGGLLILEGLREQELKYALALGFSLRATTKPFDRNGSNVETTYQSVVLQK